MERIMSSEKEVVDVSETVSMQKYYLPGEDWPKMSSRVGTFIAAAEESRENMQKWAQTFTQLIETKTFIPGGRILANAGTYFKDLNDLQKEFLEPMISNYKDSEKRCGQMLNCYVLPIYDSKHGPGSIYETLEDAADITAMEGGIGENFSFIRPKDFTIAGNKRYKASGPVSFLKVYNSSGQELSQGGGRRDANMAVLNCDHPDIFEFVNCKRTEGEIKSYNISVGIYDDFMEAVQNGSFWDLKWDGKIVRTINARELFDNIIHNIWADGGGGEPGFLFLDTIKKTWPFPNELPITSNPCVPDNVWVMTKEGPNQVKDLIGKKFRARVHGRTYESVSEGFFKTGTKDVYLLETKEGYSVELTDDHEVFVIEEGTDNKKVKVKDLKEDDLIQLDRTKVNISWEGTGGTFGEGYLMGMLVGDGTFSAGSADGSKPKKAVLSVWFDDGQKDVTDGVRNVMDFIENLMEEMPHRSDWSGWNKCPDRNEYRICHMALTALADKYGIYPIEKEIGPKIEKTSSEFQKGFISGFFDADGCVTKTGGITIRLSQNNLPRLQATQRMLRRFGIICTIFTKNRPQGGYSNLGGIEYDLVISCSDVKRFIDVVGFMNTDKQIKFENLISEYSKGLYQSKDYCRFKSLEKIGKKDVYDVTIENKHRFNANGVIISNCGEQVLGFYEACDLGALNLYSFIRNSVDGIVFDKISFRLAISNSIRFLDNVLDLNNYPLKYRNDVCRKISMAHRRIGLGIMGFADTLYALGIRYGSPRSIEFIYEIMNEFNITSHQTSMELGKEKGPFLEHKEATLQFQNRRNCATTTIAPTGTTSMVAGVSGGCEPHFGLVVKKKTTDGSGNVYYMVPDSFKLLCTENDIELNQKRLEEIFNNSGSVQGLSWFPESLQKVVVTTMDITAAEHVAVQCAFQKNIENSISKTINLPKTASKKDVEEAIFGLWKGGAKGGTLYRDGSRNFQIMNVGGSEKKENIVVPNESIMDKRPRVLSGQTFKVSSKITHASENIYITVNEGENKKPVEIFVHHSGDESVSDLLDFMIHNGVKPDVAQMLCGKMLQMAKENVTLTTRLISLCLRNNVDLHSIVKQLRKINNADLHSLHKHLSKILGSYISPEVAVGTCGETVDGKVCGGKVVYQEGCAICTVCNYSKCG